MKMQETWDLNSWLCFWGETRSLGSQEDAEPLPTQIKESCIYKLGGLYKLELIFFLGN